MATQVKNSAEYLEGKKIYEETCSSCHGDNGKTNPLIHFTVKPRKLTQSILSQAQMVKITANGGYANGANSDIMPAFKYLYEAEQINNIALYVTQAFNSHRTQRVAKLLAESALSTLDDAEMLKMGKKIFKRNCSLCHGVSGNGESAYVEQSKSNKKFLYPYNLQKIILDENQIFLYAKFGGHFWGTEKDDMPSWKKKYNDTQLKSVAKYVKEKIVKK